MYHHVFTFLLLNIGIKKITIKFEFITGIRSNETHGNEVVPGEEYGKKKVEMIFHS